ncbi:MAG: hypothetical protein ACJ8G1_18390 [Vitreoscilla sp.]
MNAPPNDSSRRRLLARGLGLAGTALLATPLARAAAAADGPKVRFLPREAGAGALARTPGDTYYAEMGLLEIRARMRTALPGASLADARVAVRDYDAAAVLDFSDEERAAIAGVIARMQPLLVERAPLYARTPWSFIKLDDRAEGGMPHTRGPHIVLPGAAVEAYVKMHRQASAAGTLAISQRGRSLLLHEQTHVLERRDPARFEPLFTQVFGFARMTPAPAHDWLSAHRCINPDGPDVAWAFPLDKIGGDGWLMPDVTMPDKPVPRMPQDFEAVGVEVARAGGAWHVVEHDGVPVRRDLDQVHGWHAHFPFPDEDFHPNEIAAVALSHWILRDVPDLDARPLMPGVAAWARTALA